MEIFGVNFTVSGVAGATAFIHGLFTVGELLPWGRPKLLDKLSAKLPAIPESPADDNTAVRFSPPQQQLVSSIVHNAGIYNLIMTAGLLFVCWRGEPASDLALVMFGGAAVAGLFGVITLGRLSKGAVIGCGAQCVLGVFGLVTLLSYSRMAAG